MSAPDCIRAVGRVVISLVLLLTPPVLEVLGHSPGPAWASTGLVVGYWFRRGK